MDIWIHLKLIKAKKCAENVKEVVVPLKWSVTASCSKQTKKKFGQMLLTKISSNKFVYKSTIGVNTHGTFQIGVNNSLIMKDNDPAVGDPIMRGTLSKNYQKKNLPPESN